MRQPEREDQNAAVKPRSLKPTGSPYYLVAGVLQMNATVNARSGQGISSGHPGGAHVLTTDGDVHFAPDTIPAKVLRHALEINDGVPLRDEF